MLAISFCMISVLGFAQKQNSLSMQANKLGQTLYYIQKMYLDTANIETLTNKALAAMVTELDPHSSYITKEDIKAMDEPLVGNFDGIGVEFALINDTLTINATIPGGPAEKVGVRAGDKIVSVDDETIAGTSLTIERVHKYLRGPKGTKVKVGVVRKDEPQVLDFVITRDKIPLNSIDSYYEIEDGIIYVRLTRFAATSYEELLKALQSVAVEPKGIVLDLRGNSGGYLVTAIQIANEFLHKGDLIVYTEGRALPRMEEYADGRGILQDIPVAVLIDESSASASEIVSGAIQDQDRGVIIGRRSFGKGLVQEPINFTDGSGIRLTVARFYTPSGRCIQKPYDKDYAYDIFERYAHGEMTSADSMKVDTTAIFYTVKGRKVYGGGGIIPDVFVPIDTTKATKFYISCNRKATSMRFASSMFDKYRDELIKISDFRQLRSYLDGLALDRHFLDYAERVDGIRTNPSEWDQSKEYMMPQIYGLVGRYSKVGEEAFYRFFLPIDETIQTALKK